MVKHALQLILAVIAGLVFAWSLAAFLYGKLIFELQGKDLSFLDSLGEVLK